MMQTLKLCQIITKQLKITEIQFDNNENQENHKFPKENDGTHNSGILKIIKIL